MGCGSSKSVEVSNPTPVPVPVPVQAPPPVPAPKPLVPKQNKKYTLIYLDVAGELIRLIFVAGKTPFEDQLIKEEEYSGDLMNRKIKKTKMPLGQVPVLKVDDKPLLCRSSAIARFVAKEVGLAGKNSLEMAIIDAVIDTLTELLEEFLTKIFPEIRNPSYKKNAIFNDFVQDTIPKYFEKFELLIKQYGENDSGYFVGDNLTWADLSFHQLITELFKISPNILDNYQLLAKNRETVSNHPNLKEYFEKRNRI